MFRKIIVLCGVLFIGGTVCAGPFFQRRTTPGPTWSAAPMPSPISIGPLHVSKQAEVHVQQPSLQDDPMVPICSQPPDTALVPIEGTGSKLPIGPKVPDKITHTLDEASIKKLKELVKECMPKQEPVVIHPLVTDETSQRLSRLLMILEWLPYVVGGIWGTSKAGPFLQWVARVAAGLPSALKDASRVPPTPPPVP